MWLLGDSANKQNSSNIHKTSLEYTSVAAEEIVQQYSLKYRVNQLESVDKTNAKVLINCFLA